MNWIQYPNNGNGFRFNWKQYPNNGNGFQKNWIQYPNNGYISVYLKWMNVWSDYVVWTIYIIVGTDPVKISGP